MCKTHHLIQSGTHGRPGDLQPASAVWQGSLYSPFLSLSYPGILLADSPGCEVTHPSYMAKVYTIQKFSRAQKCILRNERRILPFRSQYGLHQSRNGFSFYLFRAAFRYFVKFSRSWKHDRLRRCEQRNSWTSEIAFCVHRDEYYLFSVNTHCVGVVLRSTSRYFVVSGNLLDVLVDFRVLGKQINDWIRRCGNFELEKSHFAY